MARHGIPSRYNDGCRCVACRKCNTQRQQERREYVRRLRKFVQGRWISTSSLAIHGTLNAYGNWQCRCIPCTEVHCNNLKRLRDIRNARKKVTA